MGWKFKEGMFIPFKDADDGIETPGTWIDQDGNEITQSRWQPDTDLNQLFMVVDKIRERTGPVQVVIDDPEAFRFKQDQTWCCTLLVCSIWIDGRGETREKAIYAACIAAIDHIKNQEEKKNG